MAEEKLAFKQVGKAQVIKKFSTDLLLLQITLDGNPSYFWIRCFKNPKTYRMNEIADIEVNDNTIMFYSHESQVKETLARLEDYINQANIAYKAQVAETQARQKIEKEKEQANPH